MNSKSQGKVALICERLHRPAHPAGIVTMALPFYRSYSGQLMHRVRSGLVHNLGDGEDRTNHISIHFWCGNTGFLDGRHKKGRRGGGELFSETPERTVHCAVCEGKAIGAGMDGARQINGRPVLFNARM